MKKKLATAATFITLFLGTIATYAQDVSIKNNIVNINKQPYCGMKTEGSAITLYSYTVQNLGSDAKDLIYARPEIIDLNVNTTENYVYYTVFFLDENKTVVEVPYNLGFKNAFFKMLYNAKIITDTGLNVANIATFAMKYGCKCTEEARRLQAQAGLNTSAAVAAAVMGNIMNGGNGTPTAPPANQPQRNRTARVQVFGTTIQQDFKQIAQYTQDMEGASMVYTIVGVDGTVISKIYKNAHNDTGYYITLKDNKRHDYITTEKLPTKVIETVCTELSALYYM